MTKLDFQNLSDNLKHVLEVTQTTRASFAETCSMDRPYLTKLINRKVVPKNKTRILSQIADQLGITVDDLISPHDQFKDILEHTTALKLSSNRICSNENPHLILNCVTQNQRWWQATFDRHQGQYILYSRLLYKSSSSKKQKIVKSLLDIIKISKEGITFFLLNPFVTTYRTYQAFEYTGVMYPVSDYLYFIGEQRSSNYKYEIIFMIVNSSPEPVPQLLDGCITAIGVHRGNKVIGQTRIVLEHQNEQIIDWQKVLGTRLGWFDEDDVPSDVLARL